MDAAGTKTCRVCGLPQPLAWFYLTNKNTGARGSECKACTRARLQRSDAIKAAAAKGVRTRRPDALPAQPVPDRAPDTRMHRLQLQLDKHWDKLCAKAIEAALAGDRQMLKYLMEVAANASSHTGKLGLIIGELYERRLDRLARARAAAGGEAAAPEPDPGPDEWDLAAAAVEPIPITDFRPDPPDDAATLEQALRDGGYPVGQEHGRGGALPDDESDEGLDLFSGA